MEDVRKAVKESRVRERGRFMCMYMYLCVHTCTTLLVTAAQLMRPGIGQNVSCALGD